MILIAGMLFSLGFWTPVSSPVAPVAEIRCVAEPGIVQAPPQSKGGDGYTQREAQSPDLEGFSGGTVVIIAGGGVLLLAIILLIILF